MQKILRTLWEGKKALSQGDEDLGTSRLSEFKIVLTYDTPIYHCPRHLKKNCKNWGAVWGIREIGGVEREYESMEKSDCASEKAWWKIKNVYRLKEVEWLDGESQVSNVFGVGMCAKYVWDVCVYENRSGAWLLSDDCGRE